MDDKAKLLTQLNTDLYKLRGYVLSEDYYGASMAAHKIKEVVHKLWRIKETANETNDI